jgi:hypothetical protein
VCRFVKYHQHMHPERKPDMRPIFLLFFLILLMQTGFAQKNDARPAPVNSRSLEISKSRSQLLDQFLENDQLGVMLGLDRIMMLEDDDYIALYPVEYWLLSYWAKDYEVILSSCKSLRLDSLTKGKQIIRIPPQQDYLGPKLIEKLTASRDSLISQINTASLTDEEKAFLKLNLIYLLPDPATPAAQQQQLNELADNFLAHYSESDYASFTREFIRIRYKETRNGSSYFLSFGKVLFTGNLVDYYKQPTFFGFGFDIVRNNWIYELDIDISFAKTKTDMPSDNELWPKNSKALGGYVKLAVGKYLLDTKKLALAPLAGIGIFGLDPNTNSEEANKYKGAGIKTSIAGSVGFTGDLKFKPKQSNYNSFSGYRGQQNSITSLRFGYEYIATPLKSKYLDYSGTVHKVTLGIAFSTRRLQRSL